MSDPTLNCWREQCTHCVSDSCRRPCASCGAPAFYGREARWWCSACYQRTFFPRSVSDPVRCEP